VQVAEYSAGRQWIVVHVGWAHTDAEVGVLMEQARELLTDPATEARRAPA
jgi:predicted DNA-binding protein (MmcQ/YjbR family)